MNFISGFSRSCVSTCFYWPEADVLLDAGPFASIYGLNASYIFISHCHSDHISGILNLLYIKYYRNKLQGVKIYALPDTCKYIKDVLSISFQKGVINSFDIEINPLTDEGIKIKNNIYCYPLPTYHRCESMGFTFIKGKTVELTYTSDTNSTVLSHPCVIDAKHLIIETTYLEKKDIEKANSRGHIALPELENFVHKFKGEKIYPVHFLEAYNTVDIYNAIKNMKFNFLFKPIGLTL
jgi:ribonuclease BN (tRNA processing enzyme)